MTTQEIISNLTFADFKNLTLEKVRKDNGLTLIEDWKENILFSDFSENDNKEFYSADIYIIEEFQNDYALKKYHYSYLVQLQTFFTEDYQFIDREVIQKIATFENIFVKNQDKYLSYSLKEFNK